MLDVTTMWTGWSFKLVARNCAMWSNKGLYNDEQEVLVPKSSTESRAAFRVKDCADTGWPAGLGPSLFFLSLWRLLSCQSLNSPE